MGPIGGKHRSVRIGSPAARSGATIPGGGNRAAGLPTLPRPPAPHRTLVGRSSIDASKNTGWSWRLIMRRRQAARTGRWGVKEYRSEPENRDDLSAIRPIPETSALFSPKMSAARQPTACKYSRTGSPNRREPMGSLSNFQTQRSSARLNEWPAPFRRRGTDGSQTHRWREADSKRRSPSRNTSVFSRKDVAKGGRPEWPRTAAPS
jgi:hypothetical protein